jgi:hypothetical protein
MNATEVRGRPRDKGRTFQTACVGERTMSRSPRMATSRDRHVTTTMRRGYSTVAAVLVLLWMVGKAGAAQCGNTASGFEAWKGQFAGEATARGIKPSRSQL